MSLYIYIYICNILAQKKIGCHVNANYFKLWLFLAVVPYLVHTVVVYAGIINCLEILFSVFCVLCLSKFNFNSSFTKKEPFISTLSLVSLLRIWPLCSTWSHPLFTRPEKWTNFLYSILLTNRTCVMSMFNILSTCPGKQVDLLYM